MSGPSIGRKAASSDRARLGLVTVGVDQAVSVNAAVPGLLFLGDPGPGGSRQTVARPPKSCSIPRVAPIS